MRHLLWVSLISLALAGCASLSAQYMPKVDVAGIEAMPSQGMELRLAVKLRILNPRSNLPHSKFVRDTTG